METEIAETEQPVSVRTGQILAHHSDAEIENFGHLHLEYRYGYRFLAHDRLSRKNVLGGLKGAPQKWYIWLIWEDPTSFFSILWGQRC